MYSGKQLEDKAENMLEVYNNGKHLEVLSPIDVDHFAEFYLKASIDYANLSNDFKTLGLTCFYDGFIELWNDDRTEPIRIHSTGDTIFLETETDSISTPERTRFTIMHECSHLILHKRFYYVGEGQKDKIIPYQPYRHEAWKKEPPLTDSEIHEWQANRLAAALLVPRITLKGYLIDRLKLSEECLNKINLSDQIIEEIASQYEVSKEMMRRRLRDLEIIEDYFGG
ncbi:ImmA/IrrE family metallo-endopeptidase [Helcococcus kunzii]|uniref:ImmA/IrrE family metallo-endopeptidase n=1 Tax=Helcococcus kunzii TaxID=40091 RepID=UPI001C945F68|nr:ImmA/IrrE family metallo-endopeptidase [Helcococcus kunzii]QZO76317.1 ImmA/IrrE family metallo-endopeptidase [Helcococcus kunzii]